jgi:hypothetical protein
MQNRRKQRNGITSAFKGVSWHKAKRKWRVQVNGRHFGLFVSETEAAITYNQIAKELHGDFALLNEVAR